METTASPDAPETNTQVTLTEFVLALADFLRARIAEDETRARQMVGWARPGETAHRLLAECEAKRRIIRISEGVADREPASDGFEEARARHTLRLLALPYADHPEYRTEWAC